MGIKDIAIITEAVFFMITVLFLKFDPEIKYTKQKPFSSYFKIFIYAITLVLGAIVSVWYNFF